ncbi:hypothetical protein [Streptomyces sp. ME18-1-4]|uniref:hypothetical protein n=1 Tax=Streptomyces sp. ME18-1-4 TaxID=3028685 RepID=UPI0029ABE4BF|nr:hypothetical protein [Streptomyces sp. ME18-1-4]MDX3242082.1 hypothetical protein [Streptomyces sp. ME18-1-4]
MEPLTVAPARHTSRRLPTVTPWAGVGLGVAVADQADAARFRHSGGPNEISHEASRVVDGQVGDAFVRQDLVVDEQVGGACAREIKSGRRVGLYARFCTEMDSCLLAATAWSPPSELRVCQRVGLSASTSRSWLALDPCEAPEVQLVTGASDGDVGEAGVCFAKCVVANRILFERQQVIIWTEVRVRSRT